MKIKKINKKKYRGDKARVSGINKHTHSTKALYHNYVKRLFKSFGVQRWGGGIGRHTDLISQEPNQGFAGSNFPRKSRPQRINHQIKK